MTLISAPSSSSRRLHLRRAVQIDCDVQSPLWDGSLAYRAEDLSPLGMWLPSQLPLSEGDQLVVSFRPPRWPRRARPVTARAEVVRVALARRRRDGFSSGMGLCFTELAEEQRRLMEQLLRGLPPPLPQQRVVSANAVAARAKLAEGLYFEAEAPLLTFGRPAGPVAGPRHRTPARSFVERLQVLRRRPRALTLPGLHAGLQAGPQASDSSQSLRR
ncbi:MAG: PilZ domain-containing protein [Myxococcales bacterium]|nr:PilZ domain-containing protein [Myxococcales bacterium]